MADKACVSLILSGFSFNLNFPNPADTAPDDTKTTSFPLLTMSDIALDKLSILSKLI